MHLRTTGLDVGEDVSVIVVDGISGVVLVGTLSYGIGAFLGCFAVNISIYWQYLEGFEPILNINTFREFHNHPMDNP